MIGVSPLNSDLSYLIFDGGVSKNGSISQLCSVCSGTEYEGAVHDILCQALKKDLKQILTLGLQTVCSLHPAMLQLFSNISRSLGFPYEPDPNISRIGTNRISQSGLDYLQDLEYPVSSVGLDVRNKW